MTRILAGGVITVLAFSFFVCVPRVEAQGFIVTDPAVERDARRIEDLLQIKKALDLYAKHYWYYPRYNIESPAMSDGWWRRTTISWDFRKRMKSFINQLPIDPLNDPMLNFRYVYGYVPFDYKDTPDCAGKTLLFAARVETDAAQYQECDFGGTEKRRLYVITSDKQPAARDMSAGVLASFVRLFSLNF